MSEMYPVPDEGSPEEGLRFVCAENFITNNWIARLPGGNYRDDLLEGYVPLFRDIDAAMDGNGHSAEAVRQKVTSFSRSTDQQKARLRVYFRALFMDLAPILLRKGYKVRQLTS